MKSHGRKNGMESLRERWGGGGWGSYVCGFKKHEGNLRTVNENCELIYL